MHLRLHLKNGGIKIADALCAKEGEASVFTAPKLDFAEIARIDFLYDLFAAREGDEGFWLIPQQSRYEESRLVYFKGHDSKRYLSREDSHMMPFYGARVNGKTYLAVIEGMAFDYRLEAKCEDGMYTIYPRFDIKDRKRANKIKVTVREADGEDFNAVAIKYRNLLFESKRCIPIKTRANDNLKYAADSVYIRVRLAWKPVPATVLEQTPENEPKLKVACDFKRVIELMKRCRAAGVEEAEFCLVGWNVKGHDGRWPQTFPVEEELGGEEGLKELIKTAKELGYRISCHTNSTDAYKIADCWDEGFVIKDENGSLAADCGMAWSGGQMYHVCPAEALAMAKDTLKKVAEYGFNGLHYIDVMSIVDPRECHDKNHPLTKEQGRDKWLEIARVAKKLFGGFSSEGCYDFMADELDFGLYVSMLDINTEPPEFCDEVVPVWQLVYHGTVLSNPYSATVNAAAKRKDNMLKCIELCARPAIYLYSKFVDDENSNWMGTDDIVCTTEEQMNSAVEAISKTYAEYKKYRFLQTEFMDSFERTADGKVRIKYSGGTTVTVDYNKKEYKIDAQTRR